MTDWGPHRATAPGFWELILKSAVVHTATYFVVGLFAFYVFNYAELFEGENMSALMRPTTDPMVAAGLLFQPLRGALFGIVFYLLRDAVFTRPAGWFALWVMLGIVGILNTFGPALGSIEGLIYTRFSPAEQLGLGLIEVYGQALLLALGVFFWVRLPSNRWFAIGFGILAGAAILSSLAGIFLAPLANQAGA